MSRILGNASFVFNPAGNVISYKEDKAYSVLPNDGTVDGVVSGNSGGGTRVNQQGYIESTPANLNTNSEKFGGGFWNNFGGTITDDSVIAPNGTLTGDRLGDGYGRFNTSATAIPGQTYTYSVYLKNVNLTNSFNIVYAWGLNGSLVSYGNALTINISNLSTTEWKRYEITKWRLT